MGIPGILAFPPYRISCRISLAHPPDITGHKWDILVISIDVRVKSAIHCLKVSDYLSLYIIKRCRRRRRRRVKNREGEGVGDPEAELF